MARKAEHPIILIDDWNHELDIEHKFVGRHRDIAMFLKALYGGFRICMIFGIKAVGKSRLVKELISRYLYTETVSIIIRLDLSNHRSIRTILKHIYYVCLGEEPSTNDTYEDAWVLQIESCIRAKQEPHVFVLDNLDNVEVISSFSFLLNLVNRCENVTIFVTSTTQIMFDGLENVCFSLELLPLTPREAAELFKQIAPNVKFDEYERAIVKLSEGLPLLISMIANEMADENGMITPADMINMLSTSRLKCLSRTDYYAEEDRIADIYRTFMERLHPDDLQRLTLLGYIPGSFDTSEALQLLGFQANTEIENQVLIPIRRRCMLTYDAQTSRFNIQNILRECLEVYFAIKNITEVRKRFVKVFSTVMSNLCTKLGTEYYVKALSQFSLEQPNFQKLMAEVYFTTGDTYKFFITIATSCTEPIERFMSGECNTFYQGCLVMADRYGDATDKAVVNIAVGSMWTNIKCDFLKGACYYKEALNVLRPTGNRFQLATVYQGIGWNLFSQGKFSEALVYLQKSLKISISGGSKCHPLVQQSINRLGVTHTLLGHMDEAETYLFAALKFARTTLKDDHPTTGKTLNSIGLFFAAKGDTQNTLNYHLEGLEIKKRTKAHTTSLGVSMNNVASVYCARKEYDKAHQLLDDGIQLIEGQEIPSKLVLAILYNTKGKVLLEQERYAESVDMFQIAADIREVIVPEHIDYVDTLVHLAIAKMYVGEYSACVEIAKQAITLKANVTDTLPQSTIIVDCYRCLADAYRYTGSDNKHSETLSHLETELCRLKQVFRSSNISIEKIKRQLEDVREKTYTHGKKDNIG